VASTKAREKVSKPETRNYLEEMHNVLQLAVSTKKTYTAAGLARDIIRKLQRSDPDLLRGWLELQAEEVLREHISRQSRSQRAYNRRVSGRKSFGEAVDKYAESGDSKALTSWLDCSYTVDEKNTKMTLGDMTAAELDFAAQYHQKLADTNAFEAAFLAALARKVGESTVGNLYTESQLVEMRQGLAKFATRKRR
jgi:hypothetical protein